MESLYIPSQLALASSVLLCVCPERAISIVMLSQILAKIASQTTPNLTSGVRIIPGVLLFVVENVATSLIPVLVTYLNIVRFTFFRDRWFHSKLTFGIGRFNANLLGLSGKVSSFAMVDNVIATAPRFVAAILYCVSQSGSLSYVSSS